MKRWMGWVLVPVIVLALALPMLAAAAGIPGINAADKNAQGCVDCHKGDYALSKETAKIKGHVKTSDSPKSCVTCHKEGGKQPFSQILHKAHLTGSDNHYVSSYSDALCTNCHKLDTKTGNWSVKGL